MRGVLVCGVIAAAAAIAVASVGQPAIAPPVIYLCGNGSGAVEGKPAKYSGFYEAEFEHSSFKLSKAPCEVWLTGKVCPIYSRGDCVKGAKITAYVTVEGVMSPRGSYGHLGLWERELQVARVLKVHRIIETKR